MKLAVVGAGSWGTAVTSLLVRKNEHDTILWARRPELAETITLFHENPQYLPDVELPEGLTATNDLEQAVAKADVVIMAVPSHGFRAVLRQVASRVTGSPAFVSLAKGIEVETRKRMSELFYEEISGITPDRVAVLTGPNIAREVALGYPAASTVACVDEEGAARLQDVFHSDTFRCYSNNDVAGSEIGGAFKNVIAIAAGVADGLGLGDNTKATVITRGLAEMARFSVHFGAQPITFLGLAGVGDLIATCASPHSRNHTVGIELGKGRKIDDIIGSMNMVAEGVKSCKPIYELGGEAGVWMPITENVVGLCHGDASVDDVVSDLLARELRSEFHGVEGYLLVDPDTAP
jgi:glycerol-3-phosphate dehydrogenase (NAD(P)+)